MLAVGLAGPPLACCDSCVLGCGWVGGLSVGAFAVAGGVEMPFCMFSAAGDAILVWRASDVY